ncbi:hypothetical protein HOD29_05065 [archaeon]|mgnify:FL=1|nr:hypothetical protein [archaeon]
MKTRKIYFWSIALFVGVMSFSSCNVEVPPGYYGMVLTPEGFDGEVLAPGLHSCAFRNRMFLIDGKEVTATEKMNILCAGDLNIAFDLKVQYRTRSISRQAVFMDISDRKGAAVEQAELRGGGQTTARVVKSNMLYETYVQPNALSLTRGKVGKLEAMQVRAYRDELQKEIFLALKDAVKGTPVEVIKVVISNLDYPEDITRGLERKRKEEFDFAKQEAKNALELLIEDNNLRLADKSIITRGAEAEADGEYMKILGTAVTPKYLRLKRIENMELLYSKLSSINNVIVSTENVPVIVNSK